MASAQGDDYLLHWTIHKTYLKITMSELLQEQQKNTKCKKWKKTVVHQNNKSIMWKKTNTQQQWNNKKNK
jgi:hypothetical protein